MYVKRKKRHLEECGVCEMFKHLFLIIYIRLYFSVVPAIWKCVHYCVSCMFLVFLAYVFGVFLVSLMFGVMVANDNSAKVVTPSKVHTRE